MSSTEKPLNALVCWNMVRPSYPWRPHDGTELIGLAASLVGQRDDRRAGLHHVGDGEPDREVVVGLVDQQRHRLARLEAGAVLDDRPVGVAEQRMSEGGAGLDLLLDRRPVRRVVDVAEQVDVDRPEGPRLGRSPYGRITEPEPARHPPAAGRFAVDLVERLRQAQRCSGGDVDVDPEGGDLDPAAPLAPQRHPSFRPPPTETAAPRGQVEPLAPPGRPMDIDHRPADDPGRALVVDAAVGRVVVADVLQVPGAGVEPQPPGRVGVGEPDATARTEHASPVRQWHERFVEHGARFYPVGPGWSTRRDSWSTGRAADSTPMVGTLDWTPALERRDLLAAPVADALARLADTGSGTGAGGAVLVAEIDPDLADTAAFCARYDVPLDISANCVVLAAKREGLRQLAACVVLATTRADVNGVARRTLDARKASFAPMDAAVAETGMEYGGITPVGLPPAWPLLVDDLVAATDRVVVGSGVRRSKLLLPGPMVAGLPGAVVLEGLAVRATNEATD